MRSKKKSSYISFVTTPDIEKALRNAAEKEERSLSWLISKALERYLAQLGFFKPPSSDR